MLQHEIIEILGQSKFEGITAKYCKHPSIEVARAGYIQASVQTPHVVGICQTWATNLVGWKSPSRAGFQVVTTQSFLAYKQTKLSMFVEDVLPCT